MRIDRLHLDGFGRAEDSDIPLGEGLTLIRGANGAGKTTIHTFIHAVIFGFVKDVFPLVRGGRRGGVITGILADGRPFEITRHGDPVSGANQRLDVLLGARTGGNAEAQLRIIMGGVTKHVFETVFAFGQDELRDFRRLNDEDVANRIYGASIGVIGDVLKVESNLAGELDALWKPRGTNPSVNQSLAAMSALRTRLTERDLPAEYGSLQRRLAEVDGDRGQLDGQLAALDARRQELDRLLAARIPWLTMTSAQARLSGMPDEPGVTTEDLAEEARLAQGARIATDSLAAARTAREELDRQLAAITYRADVLDRAPEIDDAVSTASNWRSREADLAEARRRSGAVRASIEVVLSEAGWDQARLRSMEPLRLKADLAAHGPDDLDTPLRNLGAPTERVRAAIGEEERQRSSVASLDRRAAELAASTAVDADGLERDIRAVETDLARAATLRQSIAAAPMIERAPALSDPSDTKAASWASSPVDAAGLAVAGVILGLVLGVTVAPLFGVGVAVVGLLAAGALILVVRRQPRVSTPPEAARPTEVAEHPMSAELRTLEASIATRWTAFGLSLPPAISNLEPLRKQAALARQVEEARRANDRDRERAAADLSVASAERVAADAAIVTARREVELGAGRWAAFLVAAGLPETLDRDATVDLISRLEGARANLDEATALGQTIGKTERERLLWAEGVRRLAGDLGAPTTDDASVIAERLRQELAAARTSSRARDALVQRRDEAGHAERVAGEALVAAQAAHSGFLTLHGVADGERLAGRHARGADRASVLAECNQAEATFRQLVPDAARASVEAELRSADPGAIARQSDGIKAQRTEVATERDARTATAATLEEQLRRLRDEADTSAVRQELADRRADLESDARRWYVLRTALELLRRTRTEYEAKHRPAVLARAEALFLAWTDGEYSGFDRLSEAGLEAVVSASDGKRVPLAGLSRGTAEQLYLAMRIALVEHLATLQEPLPLIMDDVLVNFDPDRAQRVARTIEEVARTRQVIYLTCHREVAIRPSRTIELGRNVELVSVAST